MDKRSLDCGTLRDIGEAEEGRRESPGLIRGDLDEHIGVALRLGQLQLDTGWPGIGVQPSVHASRMTLTTVSGPLRSIRPEVGMATSGP